jgi:CHASE3 domain sensor protein
MPPIPSFQEPNAVRGGSADGDEANVSRASDGVQLARRRTSVEGKRATMRRQRQAIREADMQEISTRQRILLRAIVLVIIVMVLAMLGLIRRNPTIVY